MRHAGRLAGLAAGLALACQGSPASRPVETVSDGRYQMGTVLEITRVAPEGSLTRDDLAPLFDEVERLEAIFSRHRSQTAIGRLNRAAGDGPRPAPPELVRILADARNLSAETGGAFDVTVGPLVTLWTAAAQRDRLPDPEALQAALDRVGSDAIDFDPAGRVALLRSGMAIDLGGIAKGWALDRLAERLRRDGAFRALLSFGQSSTLALGTPPGSEGWRVLLRGAGEEVLGVLTLRDIALSVSASLGQWSTIEGRRYGHVVDPRSGQAVTETWIAAVVAPNAAQAEAWSTALLVLGPDAGFAAIEPLPAVEALMGDADGRLRQTSGWQAVSGFVPLPAAGTLPAPAASAATGARSPR